MFCWKCGAEVADGKRFCSDCGTMLDSGSSVGTAQPDFQNNSLENQPAQPTQPAQPAQTAQPIEQPAQFNQATQFYQVPQAYQSQQPYQSQPQQPYQTQQTVVTQTPYTVPQPQNVTYSQVDPALEKADKAYKNGKTMSNATMIMGLVSLGMLVFGILFWPFYFLLYVAGIATLVVGYFAKRNGMDYKSVAGFEDKFKKNKSSVKFGKGLAIFSMVTPIVLITIVLILLIYLASQLLGHGAEIIQAIFSSGGLDGAFDRVVTLVSELNESGALLKILSILGVLIKLI